MTNFESLTTDINVLANFISRCAYIGENVWANSFSNKFCKKCPTTHCIFEDGTEDDFHECDFRDGICPHGSDIEWWLNQESEEA